MDLNENAMFVQVVRAGSFSEAARQFGIPVSTVSTRIARLEKRLGTTLLQRTTRRLNLTEAGQQFFDRAATGLDYFMAAEDVASATNDEVRGLLRITAPTDLGDIVLSRIVTRLREKHPQLAIELTLLNRFVDLIGEGIDVAIRAGELEDSSLIARRAGDVRWQLYATEHYLASAPPLDTPEDLRNHNCLMFSPLARDSWTLFQNGKQTRHIALKPCLLVDDLRVIRILASRHQGIALLPAYYCKDLPNEDALITLLPDWRAIDEPINLVYPRQRFVAPKLRVFIEEALDELSEWLD